MIDLARNDHMRGLEPLAEEFYEKILRPDEEPGFVGDEASLYDISLAPEELLIEKVRAHYGKTLTRWDLRDPSGRYLKISIPIFRTLTEYYPANTSICFACRASRSFAAALLRLGLPWQLWRCELKGTLLRMQVQFISPDRSSANVPEQVGYLCSRQQMALG